MAKAKRRKPRKAKARRAERPARNELSVVARAQTDTRRAPPARESVEDPLRDWPEED
jgi:hypothetical protein